MQKDSTRYMQHSLSSLKSCCWGKENSPSPSRHFFIVKLLSSSSDIFWPGFISVPALPRFMAHDSSYWFPRAARGAHRSIQVESVLLYGNLSSSSSSLRRPPARPPTPLAGNFFAKCNILSLLGLVICFALSSFFIPIPAAVANKLRLPLRIKAKWNISSLETCSVYSPQRCARSV